MKNIISRLWVLVLLLGFASCNDNKPRIVQNAETHLVVFADSYEKGPVGKLEPVYNYKHFTVTYGDDESIRQFFNNGGDFAIILNTDDLLKDLDQLQNLSSFNLLVMPSLFKIDESLARPIRKKALEIVNATKTFLILDTPANLDITQTLEWRDNAEDLVGQKRAALYYPQIESNGEIIGAAAVAAGVYINADNKEGVWAMPAGIGLGSIDVDGITYNSSEEETGSLLNSTNGVAINPIRNLTGYGEVIYGGRTAQQTAYISDVRTQTYIERSLISSLGWTIWEAADEKLAMSIKLDTEKFLTSLWVSGGLNGATPKDSFEVNTQIQQGAIILKVKALSTSNEYFEFTLPLSTSSKVTTN